MTPEARLKLRQLLVSHEKYEQFPYTDTTGHLTIGVGRNLTDRGISSLEALYLLDSDIQYFNDKLCHYLPFFNRLNENRQIALVNMCFNLGVQGFLGFTQMILALEAGDYHRAAREIMDSKAALQNPERYSTLASIVDTGDI